MPRRKTVGLGPANDSDTTKLYRPPGLRWFDSGAFDWDPSRPLREQWPWSGDPDDRVIRAGAPEAIGMTPRQMRARQAEADRIEDEIRAEALVIPSDAPEAGDDGAPEYEPGGDVCIADDITECECASCQEDQESWERDQGWHDDADHIPEDDDAISDFDTAQAIAAQNPTREPDDAPPDLLAACAGCEVPFGCRDGHCIRGMEHTRDPADPDSLLAPVRECTPAELDADQPPADVVAAVERIAEMTDEPEASEP